MEIGHYVIAAGVAIVSIVVSIFTIRIFANLLIICAFLAAIIVPIVFCTLRTLPVTQCHCLSLF